MSATMEVMNGEEKVNSDVGDSVEPNLPDDDFVQYVWEAAQASDASLYGVDVVIHDGSGKQTAGVEFSYQYRENECSGALRNEGHGLKRDLEEQDFVIEFKEDGRCRRGLNKKAIIVTGHAMLGGDVPTDFPQLD